jgi:TolA-binding protein
LNGRVKNLKSQIARLRSPEAVRLAEIREQLAAGEARAEELRKEILRREKQRIDEKELPRTMESFEDVWKAMNLEEQRTAHAAAGPACSRLATTRIAPTTPGLGKSSCGRTFTMYSLPCRTAIDGSLSR